MEYKKLKKMHLKNVLICGKFSFRVKQRKLVR